MIEYFDERCTECIKTSNGDLDIDENYKYLKYIQAYYTNWNRLKDVRLSEIYYALGIPFPDNYLIDYKLKKNELVFVFVYNKEIGKFKMDIDVPDQPVLRSDKDTEEYTFVFHKED